MLNLNRDYISSFIQKARQYQVQEAADVEEDGSNATDDRVNSELAQSEEDVAYDELKLMIEDLDPDQQATLIALLWVGREDYDICEWESAYANAKKSLLDISAESFLAKPQLADFIEEGLNLYVNRENEQMNSE